MRDCDHGLFACSIASGVSDALSSDGNVTGHGGYSGGCTFRDALDGFRDLAVGSIVGLLFFDIEVFCIFTNNDKIDRIWEGWGGCD